ncbi:MAG: MlaD family protein [Gordonia amarae]
MRSIRRSLIGLALFTALAVIAAMFVVNAITQPVSGDTVSYRAVFTDATGLRPGNDVRSRGIQIGKVTDVELSQRNGTSTATVSLRVKADRPLRPDDHLAIKYLNLTGIRYVDVALTGAGAGQAGTGAGALGDGATIGVDRTTPSFDITTVFNGLQPVLAGMNPADLNHLAASMLALIQGDGTGLAPVLAGVDTLMSAVDAQSAVIDTLIDNLTSLSRRLDGHSGGLPTLLGYFAQVGDLASRLGANYRELSDSGLAILGPLNELMAAAGLPRNSNPDAVHNIKTILPTAQRALDLMEAAPVLADQIEKLLTTPGRTVDTACSHGAAPIPGDLALFLQGQRITLCRTR